MILVDVTFLWDFVPTEAHAEDYKVTNKIYMVGS